MRPFLYRVGGFEIQSSFALPGLHSIASAVEASAILVEVSGGPAPPADRELFRWPGRYGLILSASGPGWLFSSAAHASVFISRDGRLIQCYPDAASSPRWPELLVRRILPRLMQLHGRIALHAATVADDRSATVLLGPSRTGKSTLAAALRRVDGSHILSDDTSLIDGTVVPPVSLPTDGSVCLWSDSLSAFVRSTEDCRLVVGHQDKRWLDEHADESALPRPVGALVFLAPRGRDEHDRAEISFQRIAPRDAAVHAGPLMMHFNPRDPVLVAESWAAVGRLVDAVPSFSLSYPRRYECLADVAARLSACVRDSAIAAV